jgi:hypothetical protein
MADFSRRLRLLLLLGAALYAPAGALHFDHDFFDYTAVDELCSAPGKELKAWSDTAIRITGVGIRSRTNVSWQYRTNRSIPCTLAVGDTFSVRFYVSFLGSAESPAVDSVIFVVNQRLSESSFVPLRIPAFPHKLITANAISGPASDTAGACLRFSGDSVYCTLRHAIQYVFEWGDGFWSPWTDVGTAVHSWSIPRRYTICVQARCQGNLSTDCSQPFPMTIADAGVHSSAGAYRSGLFAREVAYGGIPGIDFSKTAYSSPDGDIVFKYARNYSFLAPYGIFSLGILDSLPMVFVGNYLGFIPDSDAVCKSYTSTFDSLIESLHVVCPAAPSETSMHMENKQVCVLRTKEGHCAIVAKIGDFIGSHYGELYYWGYQSDGNRMLSPGRATGIQGKAKGLHPGTVRGPTIAKHGTGLSLALPRDGTIRAVSIYRCDGSLVCRRLTGGVQTSFIDLDKLPQGMHIVCVQTGKKRMYRRIFNTQ